MQRSVDLKKNLGGAQRYLDVLREMSSVVSENKMFQLNECLEQNTKRLCTLQDSSKQSAKSLHILLIVFAGMLAFEILDRVTGDWSVSTTTWLTDFFEDYIEDIPGFWFGVSMALWIIVACVVCWAFKWTMYREQGQTTLRIRFDRKINLDRFEKWLKTKSISSEDRKDDISTEYVRVSFKEKNKRDWGGGPCIVVEYDETHSFLLVANITYSHRRANKAKALTQKELKNKIFYELDKQKVWDEAGEDCSSQDLAAHKRKSIDYQQGFDTKTNEVMKDVRREIRRKSIVST